MAIIQTIQVMCARQKRNIFQVLNHGVKQTVYDYLCFVKTTHIELHSQYSNPVTGWFRWASKLRIFTPDRERVLKEETMRRVIASKVMFTPDSDIA